MNINANVSLESIKLPIGEKLIFGKFVYNNLTKYTSAFPDLPIPINMLPDTTNQLNDAHINLPSGLKQYICMYAFNSAGSADLSKN